MSAHSDLKAGAGRASAESVTSAGNVCAFPSLPFEQE